jgi:hypothetical protein
MSGLLSPRGTTSSVTVDTSDLEALVGEVQATPTANTLLSRLKTLATSLASLLTSTDKVIPAPNFAVITPSDSTDLPNATRGIWVGVAGDIKVNGLTTGTGIVLKNAPVGLLVGQFSRVYATGTTATDLVAEY